MHLGLCQGGMAQAAAADAVVKAIPDGLPANANGVQPATRAYRGTSLLLLSSLELSDTHIYAP